MHRTAIPGQSAIPLQPSAAGYGRRTRLIFTVIVIAAWGMVASHDLWMNAAANAGGFTLALLLIVPPMLVVIWSLFMIPYAAFYALGVFVIRAFDRVRDVARR